MSDLVDLYWGELYWPEAYWIPGYWPLGEALAPIVPQPLPGAIVTQRIAPRTSLRATGAYRPK